MICPKCQFEEGHSFECSYIELLIDEAELFIRESEKLFLKSFLKSLKDK